MLTVETLLPLNLSATQVVDCQNDQVVVSKKYNKQVQQLAHHSMPHLILRNPYICINFEWLSWIVLQTTALGLAWI